MPIYVGTISSAMQRTTAVYGMASMNSELSHLQQLVKMTPRTASGRVAAAWAVIKANLAAGKKLREVYEAAQRDGLGVPYAQFRVYIHRLRKRDLRRGMRRRDRPGRRRQCRPIRCGTCASSGRKRRASSMTHFQQRG